MSCGVGQRHGWDLVLLWLWRRLAGAAPIQPLHWEIPKKKPKKKKKSWRKANFFFFFFSGLHLRHMEIPKLGLNWNYSCQPMPQPQQLGIQAAHDSWQRWILNPLSEARDRTCIFMDTSGFITTEPQQELLRELLRKPHLLSTNCSPYKIRVLHGLHSVFSSMWRTSPSSKEKNKNKNKQTNKQKNPVAWIKVLCLHLPLTVIKGGGPWSKVNSFSMIHWPDSEKRWSVYLRIKLGRWCEMGRGLWWPAPPASRHSSYFPVTLDYRSR